MSQYAIGQRYARALYMSAQESGELEAVYADMQELNGLIASIPELSGFVNNPLFSLPQREKIINKLFQGKVHPLTMKFINFLNQKERLYCLDEIVVAFDEIYLKFHGQIRAVVQTALPLTEDQKQSIVDKLSQKSGRKVLAQWNINRSLIGGFRVIIEGKLYDYSFNYQLEQFKQHIFSTSASL